MMTLLLVGFIIIFLTTLLLWFFPEWSPIQFKKNVRHLKNGYDIHLRTKIEEIKKRPASKLKLSKIVNQLDIIGTGDVLSVAVHLPLEQSDIDSLHPHAAGGGSPAEAFVQTLCIKRSTTLIKELKEILRNGRMDSALDVLNDYDANAVLGSVSPYDRRKLIEALTQPIGVNLNDWHYVAEEFDLTENVPTFEAHIRVGNSHSRTRALFRLIGTKYPNAISVGDFLNAVEQAGNISVKDLITEQIAEEARKELDQ